MNPLRTLETTCSWCRKTVTLSGRPRKYLLSNGKGYCSKACGKFASSAAMKGKRYGLGHKMTAEHRAKLVAAFTKYKTPEEKRAALRLKNHKRRAEKKSAGGRLTANDWVETLKASGGKCYYCRKRRKLTVDHVTPLSKGGAHSRENIVAACSPCNSSKGARQWLLL